MDKCRICGTELSPSNRDPCPKCGGTIRVLDLAVSDGFVIRDSISGTHKQKWSGESLTLFFGIVAILLTIVSLGIINLLPFKQEINYLILIAVLLITSAVFWWLRYSILQVIRKLESKFGGEKKFK